MGFDEIKNKLTDLASEHDDKIDDGVDKLADMVDDKTGGEHSDKIDSVADKAKGLFGDDNERQPGA